MKAILKFDLPEEVIDFHSAINGGDALAVISEIDNHLRSRVKYASDDTPEIVTAACQGIRDELRRLLEEYNVSVD